MEHSGMHSVIWDRRTGQPAAVVLMGGEVLQRIRQACKEGVMEPISQEHYVVISESPIEVVVKEKSDPIGEPEDENDDNKPEAERPSVNLRTGEPLEDDDEDVDVDEDDEDEDDDTASLAVEPAPLKKKPTKTAPKPVKPATPKKLPGITSRRGK